MVVYTDTSVGHKLIVERKGLGRKLHLQKVTYNGLLWEIMTEINEIDTETIYEDIESELEKEIRKNYLEKLDFTNGGIGKGRTKTERRINFLQFKFKDSYLKKTLEIFSNTH